MADRLFQVARIVLFLVTALAVFNLFGRVSSLQQLLPRSTKSSTCRCFPGDDCWPTESEWNEFNQTLKGKLIATKPIASVCHLDPFEAYDVQKCADLQSNWNFPETHFESSSSIMAPFFANQSCDPFYPKSAQCIIGSYNQYAVNASEASDYQNTIEFVKKNNIRLTIRNTGHDYYGKSTGAGAVGIWTHNIKNIEFLDYQSLGYTGKAMKIGAGVQVLEASTAAHVQGLVVVGGDCPTVGVAGGYAQGGGHGPLASKFGLAADQVLEWEVVTGTGELLTASPSKNSDLYWALSGGGGGTYGVVLSLTSKAHPDQQTAAANLTFSNEGVSQDTFYDAVKIFVGNLPPLADAGAVSLWLLSNTTFSMAPATGPGMTKAQLQDLLHPAIAKLDQSHIKYTYFVEDYPTYLDSYKAMNPPTNTSNLQIGGRLIPRSLVELNLQGFIAALRFINAKGALISGLSLNVSQKAGSVANAVNPPWRDALLSMVLGTFWSNTDWNLNLANQGLMTDVLLPQLEQLCPNSGAYLNEADFQQPNFQQAFYGSNYDTLRTIKKTYDPDDIFYVLQGVGSESWTTADDGRLCMSQSSIVKPDGSVVQVTGRNYGGISMSMPFDFGSMHELNEQNL